MAARASEARRLRAYKLACFPITESLRIGLISRHEAFVQMRAAYVEVYGAAHPPPPVVRDDDNEIDTYHARDALGDAEAREIESTTNERNPK